MGKILKKLNKAYEGIQSDGTYLYGLVSNSPKATGLTITLAATVISRLFFSRFKLTSGLAFATLNYGCFLAADKFWSKFCVRNEQQPAYVQVDENKADESGYMPTSLSIIVITALSLVISPAIFKKITGRTLSTYSIIVLTCCCTAGKFMENLSKQEKIRIA